MDDMPEQLEIAFEGKYDAVFEKLGDTTDTFRQKLADGIRLLKIVVRIINEDRDAVRDVVFQHALDRVQCGFGVVRAKLGKFAAALIKIDIEVRRLDELPVEVLVFDLILAKDR